MRSTVTDRSFWPFDTRRRRNADTRGGQPRAEEKQSQKKEHSPLWGREGVALWICSVQKLQEHRSLEGIFCRTKRDFSACKPRRDLTTQHRVVGSDGP